jgi:flagellar basal-body rod modification protein FlgD
MATSAILSQNSSIAQALATHGNTAAAGASADTSSTSSTNSATISANDFLSLLVTEMQNQDPTADTDPNEYINQLVQVNSLEQLISINQDLTPTSSTSGSASTAATASAANPVAKTAAATAANTTADGTSALNYAPGNLSVPQASSASQSVAHALDGQSRTPQTSVNGFPGVL